MDNKGILLLLLLTHVHPLSVQTTDYNMQSLLCVMNNSLIVIPGLYHSYWQSWTDYTSLVMCLSLGRPTDLTCLTPPYCGQEGQSLLHHGKATASWDVAPWQWCKMFLLLVFFPYEHQIPDYRISVIFTVGLFMIIYTDYIKHCLGDGMLFMLKIF